MNLPNPVSSAYSQSNLIVKEFVLNDMIVNADGTLDLTLLHELNSERYPFLLESVAKSIAIPGSDAILGQFDILFAFPQHTIELTDLQRSQDFVQQVQSEFENNKDPIIDGLELPFTGGWFAYFSYDYAQVIEPVLELPESEFPLASLTRIPSAVVVNHEQGKLFLVAEAGYETELELMQQDVNTLFNRINNLDPSQAHKPAEKVNLIATIEEPEDKYLNGVKAIKEYILAGDVFQVNLSRKWQVELDKESHYLAVYRALRESNPAPFAALANFPPSGKQTQPWQIMSSSPERLVKFDHHWVDTRPIAGTRKRGEDLAADQALIEELIKHPKERAEHIMLIDLERNDLGRICQPGTVEVNELMVVETYEHVHHIVSNVRGQLRDGFSPLDIVHALFPGGTITGCPKIRCMEIVAELEQMPREAYTGSLGYINRDGSMDLNILIRTMIQSVVADKPMVQFRAGAGIVADSEAEFELTETRHKAKGLIRAFASKES